MKLPTTRAASTGATFRRKCGASSAATIVAGQCCETSADDAVRISRSSEARGYNTGSLTANGWVATVHGETESMRERESGNAAQSGRCSGARKAIEEAAK